RLGGADQEDAHRIGVLFAENSADAGDLLGFGQRHRHGRHRHVEVDSFIHQTFDFGNLVVRQRLVVREIEASLVGVDERSFLVNGAAKHFAQRPIEQVGGGVVAHGVGTDTAYFHGGGLPDVDVAFRDPAEVQDGIAQTLRILNLEATGGR